MSEWLRSAWNRPIGERERKAAFAVATIVLVGGAVILSLLTRDSAPSPTREPQTGSSSQAPERGVPANEAPPTQQQDAATINDVRPVAEAFLKAYLPYTYGGPARPLRATASEELYSQLASAPPRAPVGARARSARVLTLTSGEDSARDSISVRALVADASSRYTVTLHVERSPRGWRVVGVEGT